MEVKYNGPIQKCKATQVHEDVRIEPRRDAEEVPAEEGAARVLGGIEAQAPVETRKCWDCGEEKPLSEWNFRKKKNGAKTPKSCKACHTKRAIAWRKAHPEKHKRNQSVSAKRRAARAKAYKNVLSSVAQGQTVRALPADSVRRLLVEFPPELRTEGERLAYYRGFLAGCGRREHEEGRFEEYRDLIFRVVAGMDKDMRLKGVHPESRLTYEDMISQGYEAVLEIIRKKQEPPRSVVAAAIRRQIYDLARSEFGRPGHATTEKAKIRGAKAYFLANENGEETSLVDLLAAPGAPEIDDEDEALWERVRLKAVGYFRSPRKGYVIASLLRGRGNGLTLGEAGARIGLSESSACQILKKNSEWIERELAPLARTA